MDDVKEAQMKRAGSAASAYRSTKRGASAASLSTSRCASVAARGPPLPRRAERGRGEDGKNGYPQTCKSLFGERPTEGKRREK